jgi:hypothetical protein
MTRTEILNQIENYMTRKNIDSFWMRIVLRHINNAMAGNRHFISNVKNPRISIDRKFPKALSVKRLSMSCTIQGESGTTQGTLVYKQPTKRFGHRIDIKAI